MYNVYVYVCVLCVFKKKEGIIIIKLNKPLFFLDCIIGEKKVKYYTSTM